MPDATRKLTVDQFIELIGGPEYWPPEIDVSFCRGVWVRRGDPEPDPEDPAQLIIPVTYVFDQRWVETVVKVG